MVGGGLLYGISYFHIHCICIQWHCMCSISTILIHSSLLLVPTLPRIVSLPAFVSSCLIGAIFALPWSSFFCFSDPTCILTHVHKLHTYTWVFLDTVRFIGLISCFSLFLTFWDCFFEFCWKHSQVKQLTFPQKQKWEASSSFASCFPLFPPFFIVLL